MGEVQYIYRAMDSEDEVQISLDVSIRVLWKPNIIIARRTPLQDPLLSAHVPRPEQMFTPFLIQDNYSGEGRVSFVESVKTEVGCHCNSVVRCPV